MTQRALHSNHAPQRIVDVLRLGVPLTTAELQRALQLNRRAAEEAVRRLHARGNVRPVGFERHRPRSRRRAGAILWTLVLESQPCAS
ncbi:MAG: hypothetical protein EPN36_12145 [Rhodanobacteraceae bacterium]|nr:MAG: hypothetical protein EPN36_12145 [Rhodanobacteraceae bacterium]